MPRTLCLLVALGAVVLVSFPSWAGEIYRWTDERGTVHLTDDPSKIPEAYQNRVKKVDVPEETPKDIPTVPKQKSPSEDRVKQYLEEMDRKIEERKRLEGKISVLEEELRLAQERLKWIDDYDKEHFQYQQSFRDRRTGRFVAVGSPYYDERVRLENKIEGLTDELASLGEELDQIKRSL